MRKINLILIFAIPTLAFSQKIKKSEYDKFVKKYRIETNFVAVKQGLSNGLSLGIRSIDTTLFLVVAGYGRSSGVVAKNNKLILLLSDDNTIEVLSKDIQSYNIGQYQNSFLHEYYISSSAIKNLQTATVKSLRIYNSDGYVDIDIKSDDAKDINQLSAVFYREFELKKSLFAK